MRINDKDYFAPLSSDKNQKYRAIKESNPTVYKIITNNNNYLGVIKLNNMIPVKKSELHQITRKDILEKDSKYQKLINTQRIVINRNEDKIKQKAELLYRLVVEQKMTFIVKFLQNFINLKKPVIIMQIIKK